MYKLWKEKTFHIMFNHAQKKVSRMKFLSQRNSTAPCLKPLGASFPVDFNVDLNS